MGSDENDCPLCGESFRGILTTEELKSYMRSNPVFSVCYIGEGEGGEYHTIHTNPEREWLTPPIYVLDRTVASVGVGD